MTDLIELAKKSGFWKEHCNTWMCNTSDLEALSELIREDEREQCAKVCEELSPKNEPVEYGDIRWGWKYKCPYAHAIRAKGNT
jgi:hypothetical protein